MEGDAALLDAARAARGNAYAPYSHFRVGSAVRTADGTIFVGANVENASYGLSMCAERAAICAAISAGRPQIVAIAVAGPEGVASAPCGACRQFIREFGAALPVTYTGDDGLKTRPISELLPEAFGPKSLQR